MAEYSKGMLSTFAKVVQAYEQAILDLEENGVSQEEKSEWWKGYGNFSNCRLCREVYFEDVDELACSKCVLGPGKIGCLDGAVGLVTFFALRTAINDNEVTPRLFKNRLAWIPSKAESNGVIVE